MKKLRSALIGVVISATLVVLTACSGMNAFGESLNRALEGVPATMTTYTQSGEEIDEVKGVSFQVSRDSKFDTVNSEGGSNQDSSVLLISLGDSHISHVGSTLILAQDGMVDVTEALGTAVAFENVESGVPWLNNLREYNQNLWQGKAKTLLIRSQDGTPIAVYAGDEVEIFGTDVPKSTTFRVDGKYLFVYRADYSVYDNDLLG